VISSLKLKAIGVCDCSAYIGESGAKFGILQSSMHSNENVAEYVIVCILCNSKLFVCDGFLLPILLNIPNLSIVVKTNDPVRVRERERIKEFICKPVYLLKSTVEP
jgi:hypothetical protein